jgi:hypothetical protein
MVLLKGSGDGVDGSDVEVLNNDEHAMGAADTDVGGRPLTRQPPQDVRP